MYTSKLMYFESHRACVNVVVVASTQCDQAYYTILYNITIYVGLNSKWWSDTAADAHSSHLNIAASARARVSRVNTIFFFCGKYRSV